MRTAAERVARARRNRSAIIMLLGVSIIVPTIWIADHLPGGHLTTLIICTIVSLTTLVFFLRTVLTKNEQCPKCKKLTASYLERDSIEFLSCRTCGFDQPTGYDYSS